MIFGSHNPNKPDMRCAVCSAEWNAADLYAAGARGCPSCDTKVQPQKIAEDGYLRMNWQELRVLAIFAQRWAAHFDLSTKGNRDALQALQNILIHLEAYRPKTGETLDPPPMPLVNNGVVVGQVRIRRLHPVPDLVENENATLTPDAEGNILSVYQPKKDTP